MNKQDRENFNVAENIIREQAQVIQELGEAETEKFDNLNEGLQASERGQGFEAMGEALTELASEIESALDCCDIDNL